MGEEEPGEGETPREFIVELQGTDLSDAANEFWAEQRARIRNQLKIIAEAKWAFKAIISAQSSKDAIDTIAEFEQALKNKEPFEQALTEAKEVLERLGELEKWDSYFRLFDMIKRKVAFGKIIAFLKPWLEPQGRWSDWKEKTYFRHNDQEEGMLQILRDSVGNRPIWKGWLSEVRGIGLVLTAQVIGGFEMALKPEETLGAHFGRASQMVAFAGLDVDPETGKARRRMKGQKLTFNPMLRSVLIGRVGTSFLRQSPLKSGYRRIYDQQKARLTQRYQREGIKIVPSAKLPKDKGIRYEPKDMISEGHVHQQAMRAMMKIFVHHLWEMIRKYEGLPSGKPYVIEVLGHPESSYIPPIRDKEV